MGPTLRWVSGSPRCRAQCRGSTRSKTRVKGSAGASPKVRRRVKSDTEQCEKRVELPHGHDDDLGQSEVLEYSGSCMLMTWLQAALVRVSWRMMP